MDEIFSGIYLRFLSSLFFGYPWDDMVSDHGHWQNTIEIKFDKTKQKILKKIS